MGRKKLIPSTVSTKSGTKIPTSKYFGIAKKVQYASKTTNQKNYIKLIKEKEIIISCGPSGVGKSFIAIACALELLQNHTNPFKKILIIKPAIESEENLGFLPGTLHEKLAPYLASSIDIVDKIIGKSARKKIEECGILMAEPLGFIRGKTIDNSLLIVEEGQNISPSQMKTILTRLGSCSKFIISGDLDQSDKFKSVTQSGLYDIINRHNNIIEIGFLKFNDNDIIRNPLITKILNNYN